MAKIVLVTGTPGAGKSSVLDTLARDKRYKLRNLADVMLAIAMKKGYCKDRDKLRYLPNTKIKELRLTSARQLARENGMIILDTHASVEEHGRIVPGLPRDFLDALKGVSGFVYIDSDTDLIISRRKRDRTRARENESSRIIETQRIVNLSTLSYGAAYLNIPIYIVNNREGELGESQKHLRLYLKDAFQ